MQAFFGNPLTIVNHKKPTQAQLSKLVNISPRTLRTWRDQEGLDLSDVEAVKARAAQVASNDETMNEAKRRRAVASADAEEIRVARMKGKLIERDLAEQLLITIGNSIKMLWKQTPAEIAGYLDGRVGAEAQKALETWVDTVLFPRWSASIEASMQEIENSVDDFARHERKKL